MGLEGFFQCPCKACEYERRTEFEKVGGVVQFMMKHEHHDAIEELKNRKSLRDIHNDQDVWKKIFSEDVRAFQELSKSSQDFLESIAKSLIRDIPPLKNPSAELLHILKDLEGDSNCVKLIRLLNQENIPDKGIRKIIEKLYEITIKPEISDAEVQDMEEKIAELEASIPKDLQENPPEILKMPADELYDLVAAHIKKSKKSQLDNSN